MGKTIQHLLLAAIAGAAAFSLGCSEFTRQGSAPFTLVVDSLEATSGATGNTGSSALLSDVETFVGEPPAATIFNDTATVTLRLIAKDPVGVSASPLNAVTISRYRVTFRRSDGRNTPGVDVPFPIDSALTVTVPAGGVVSAGFELVRHTMKSEAPLAALRASAVTIATVADVTFFGRDQAGNNFSAAGSIGVNFGDFGDP